MDDYQKKPTWRQEDVLPATLEKVGEHRHNIA